jgi:glucosyl-dolichyl phosphate glucuronosyltransferase
VHGADCVCGKILPKWLAERPSWLGPYFMHRLALLDNGDQPFVISSIQHQLFGANFALTKRVCQRVGEFNVELGNRGSNLGGEEDTEFFRRLLAAGCRVVYAPQAVVWHKIPAERMSKQYFRRWHRDHGVTAASITKGPGLFGMPFWTIKACGRELVSYVGAVVVRDTRTRMAQEMKLRYYAGLFGKKLEVAWRGRSARDGQ